MWRQISFEVSDVTYMTESNWSVPETEIVQRISNKLDDEGETRDDILATIVDVEGNAYRRPGAKMILEKDGSGVGSITAGCLEDELLSAATAVRETGQPERVTYDLTSDGEDVWGLGVGCNGVLDVLLEPLDRTYQPAIEALERGEDVTIITVLSEHGNLDRGDRVYFIPDEDRLCLPDGSTPEAGIWPDGLSESAAKLAQRGRADVFTTGEDSAKVKFFIDGLSAPPELVIFGNGHDVGPVTELAERNGFRVTVIGFRGAVDLETRFPSAHQTVTSSPGSFTEVFDIGERTYTVIMTHNFIDDRLTLETLLDSPVSYVGLMGPQERFERMLEEFDTEGTSYGAATLESVYTPIGLDLGGGSPYQIAHSIVAEILAVENDRDPRHLRERDRHIHNRVDIGGVQ